jgi:uncharacterized protein YggE
MRLRSIPVISAVISLSALVTIVSLVVARPSPVRAAPTADDDLRSTISVVGDGRVLVQPDVAQASFGVEATGQTLSQAQADAATRMQAVVDALVAQGVSRDDIRTSRLSANPVYDQKNNTVIQGYHVANSVQVKLRQLDQVGAIVDAVTAAGANRVDGLSFAVEDQETPKGQARALAMQNARAKADQLASLAGLRVVSVKSVQESDASATPVRAQPQAAYAAAPGAAPVTPVDPGSQEVRTQVSVTYIVE